MRIDNTQIAISKTVESGFNVPDAVAANYEWLPSTDPLFILPKLEKISDAARTGRNAPSHNCNTYWSPSSITVKDDIETGVPARLFRRALGGVATSSVVAAGVYDHTFAILPPQIGDILPSFDIAAVLGPASFLLAGLMVNKIKFSQKNGDRVQHESSIVGSGRFLNPHGLAAFPTLGDLPCMDGHKTVVGYTDAKGTDIFLSELGTVSEWMVDHDNKIRTNRRRSGDPTQIVTYGTSTGEGAYVRKLPRGKYITTAQIVVDFVDLNDWKRSVVNEVLNNFTVSVPGSKIANVSGTDYFHTFEIKIPRFGFDSPDTGSDEDDASTPINIIPFEDPVTRGTLVGRIRNGNPTLF